MDNPPTQKIFTQVQVVMTVETLKELCDRLRSLEEKVVILEANSNIVSSVSEAVVKHEEELRKFKATTIDKCNDLQKRLLQADDSLKAFKAAGSVMKRRIEAVADYVAEKPKRTVKRRSK